ncbi:hypothetical protein [Spirosoma telluris]
MLELHESIHILVGRLICGCWGERDFNVWGLCAGCAESHSSFWLSTLAGPVLSFSFMWLGMYWLTSPNAKVKAIGFSLIFSNIPFGRISEVIKGAGDEMVVTRYLLKSHFTSTQMILICLTVVLILGLPPISQAFRLLTNKKPWLYILGFLTLPIAFILVYILLGMNTLLSNGFLSAVGIMGTPLLITIHSTIALFFLFSLRGNLYSLNTNYFNKTH